MKLFQEELASRIAQRIVRWQNKLATILNQRLNRYPKTTQKKLLLLFCTAWIVLIGFNLSRARFYAPKPNLLPVFIGKPSIRSKPVGPTDSLILKK